MAENWDTETAKDCKIPRYIPEACKKCRDLDWCINHRQITIDEIKEKDNDELMERDRADRPGNI